MTLFCFAVRKTGKFVEARRGYVGEWVETTVTLTVLVNVTTGDINIDRWMHRVCMAPSM